MRWDLRFLRSFASLALAVACCSLQLQAADELGQHLRDQFNDKTLVLRNFYQGERLSYDSAGSLVGGSAASGDWTVDGFIRVTKLTLSGQRLTMQAERLSLGNTGQSFQFQQYFDKGKKDKKQEEKAEKEHRLRIEVEFDAGGITAEKADAALSRIFLTAQDRLADLMPDYWKPCVLAASTGNSMEPAGAVGSSQNRRTLPIGKRSNACSFPAEFASIPGVLSSSDETAKADQAAADEAMVLYGPTGRIGKGVTPPKVISQTEPEFSEQARSAKYQGVVVLSFIVDKTGQVRNLRVLQPLGFGLDRNAVETVSRWRFNPAEKDGEPIAVEIAAEVNFHLY
jgi:TonB family protein